MKQNINHDNLIHKATDVTRSLVGNTVSASAVGGEISFVHIPAEVNQAIAMVNPIKCLAGGFVNLIKGFAAAFKDKKRLIPAIIMALMWILLTLLPAVGINLTTLKWLSFLTLAQSGTTGGIPGLVGGVVAKGVFAFLITSLILPLFAGKNPFKNIGEGFKRFFGSFAAKDSTDVSLLLFGGGAAFIAFNFMTGTNSELNCMAGIASFLVALKSLSSKAGFLQKFAGSLTAGLAKKSAFVTQPASRLISGWAAGFALASAASFLPIAFPYLSYAFGALLMIAGVIFLLIPKTGKEVMA